MGMAITEEGLNTAKNVLLLYVFKPFYNKKIAEVDFKDGLYTKGSFKNIDIYFSTPAHNDAVF